MALHAGVAGSSSETVFVLPGGLYFSSNTLVTNEEINILRYLFSNLYFASSVEEKEQKIMEIYEFSNLSLSHFEQVIKSCIHYLRFLNSMEIFSNMLIELSKTDLQKLKIASKNQNRNAAATPSMTAKGVIFLHLRGAVIDIEHNARYKRALELIGKLAMTILFCTLYA